MALADWFFVLGIGLLAACGSDSSDPSDNPGRKDAAAGTSHTAGDSDGDAASELDADLDDGATSEPDGDSGADAVSDAASDGGSDSESEAEVPHDVAPLPKSTLLYVRHETQDHDLLMARDLESGDERVITDLTGDGSSGWDIDGFSLSPDRRRIALASLYQPTSADTATGLATRAIWTLSVDGTDFVRLTPTFPADAQGRQGFQYDVGYPEWTADGSQVLFDFGSYWWEGTNFKGGSFPWIVSATGASPPESFPTPSDCTVIYPARNPVTGEFLFIHSVCIPGQGDGAGLYLYPAAGGTNPQQLVSSAHVDGRVDVSLKPARWFLDGSGFLFIGATMETEWRTSILAYDFQENTISLLVPAPPGSAVYGVAISPDSTKLVYCLRSDEGGLEDLHLIDLAESSPTDVAITTDGKSCEPSF